MTYYNQSTGPFSPFPVPSNVILTVPNSDNTIDIGTSTKRYRTLYATDVKNTTLETTTITATTLNSNPIANLVSNPGTSTGPNLPHYADSTGKVLEDTGIDSHSVVTLSGSAPGAGHVALWTGTSGPGVNIQDSSINSVDIVKNPLHTSVANNLASFTNLGGIVIQDSGVPSTAVVQNNTVTPSVDKHIVRFVGTSGLSVADAGFFADNTTNLNPNNSNVCDLGSNTANFKTCWLRDAAPAVGCLFSMWDQVIVQNTTTDTSLLTGTHVGSLSMAAGPSAGTIVRFKLNITYSGNGVDTVNLNLKLNTVVIATITIPASALTTVRGTLDVDMQVFPGGTDANVNMRIILTPIYAQVYAFFAPATWTGANTLDVSAQWSAANGADILSCEFAYIETLFSR